MDLPTYTNIWRIEKRLYKLYDLRLPMPLPIVWIGVFVGVTAPWSFLLAMLGVPFDAPWHVVYLVPPGVVTWLSTRPVIEGKRLTELLQSQARYLGEPRTWCRMAPSAEPAEITFVGRVWRTLPEQAGPVRVKAARKAAAEVSVKVSAEDGAEAERKSEGRAGLRAAGKVPRKARHAAPKRGTEAPRSAVRPAVAAAAAAAAAAPVTGDRVVWGTASAPRKGTAPALGGGPPALGTAGGPAGASTGGAARGSSEVPFGVAESAAPVAPESVPAERSGGLTVVPPPGWAPADSAGSAAGLASAPGSTAGPASGSGSGSAAGPASGAAAGPVGSTPGPASGASSARPPVRVPGSGRPSAETGQAPATPIDAEALRRLRRLAAAVTPATEPAEPAAADASAGPGVPAVAGAPATEPPGASDSPDAPAAGEPAAPGAPGERPGVPAAADASEPPASESPASERSASEPLASEPPEAFGERKAWPQERPVIVPGGVSIRAVPTAPAPVDPATPVAPPGPGEARVRRVESVIGRDSEGGWRRLAQVVMGPGGSRTDGSEVDEARARGAFTGSRRVVVLGCTGGAGQTTTALMLGHTLARHREDRVLAVDAGAGAHALSTRVEGESPETLSSLLAGLENVQGYLGMRAYTSRCASGLEVLASDADAGAEQRLTDRALFSDRRLGQAMDLLERHYKLVVVDPAAALAARLVPHADQLVMVVPASEDGAESVAMTYDWLDGHGCADLRRRAIVVVNGVSRRSMADVEQAEAVARGRCRAIVRVPWEDELAPGRSETVEPSHLRAPGRRAYLALAGVVVAGLAAARTSRTSEEELAQ
ncbi:TcpE family conjugal transfer membrane protein [Planomonospora corallina]|uniref:TcpE family conjugal transfer membrane protein n=1 Tax=Planomonospora corallina TaxID=1806052 RepID=A0ABV8I5Q2_9ACTN